MKRHIFKKGDGVICSSNEEGKKLLNIAHNNGYPVYSNSLRSNNNAFVYIYDQLVGCGTQCITNNLTPKEFLFLVSQFEKGDEVKLLGLGTNPIFGECFTTVVKDVENGRHYNELLQDYRLDTKDYVTYVSNVRLYKDVSKQKNNQSNTDMNNQEDEIVIIPADLLREGYKAANASQRLEMESYVNSFTGEVSRKHLQDFYVRLNCTGWKTKLEICFPFLKETKDIVIKYGEKADEKKLFGGFGMISPRSSGSLRERSFYLSYKYNWSLQKDNEGAICLVPTRK